MFYLFEGKARIRYRLYATTQKEMEAHNRASISFLRYVEVAFLWPVRGSFFRFLASGLVI